MILENTKRKVVINAGHDDNDSGATRHGKHEAAETKKIRDEVVRILEADGKVEVLAVPDSLNLVSSIDWANEKVDSLSEGLVVDIHLNSNNNLGVRGAEAYYGHSVTSESIAKALSSNIAMELGIPDRGAKPDTETYVGSLGWIRQTKGWASLVEVCYMSNGEDWAQLNEEGGHTRAAQGIVNGIYEVYGIKLEKEDSSNSCISYILPFLKKLFNRTDIIKVKEEHENDLLNKKNVVGVGVGKKNKTGADSIVVLVEKKEELSALSLGDAIPAKINNIQTDVIEIGEVNAMAEHTTRQRPVYGGTSAIWQKGTACTLGAIVYKDEQVYALQNTHCANPHWKGAKLGDKIIQPSGSDGGSKSGNKDVIGTSAEYRELILDSSTANEFDSALVKLDVDATKLYQEGFGAINSTPAEVNTGDVVWKSGRTTGVQSSKVIAKGVTVRVNYGTDKPGLFRNQIIAENEGGYFTSGGDSSSLVVNKDRNPVGQIFAGSDKIAIFSPIQPIIDYFGFSFDIEESLEGYMALAIQDGELYMKPVPESIQPKMRVKTLYPMNFRSSAEIGNNKVTVLPNNSEVEVLETTTLNDGYVWAKVKVKK